MRGSSLWVIGLTVFVGCGGGVDVPDTGRRDSSGDGMGGVHPETPATGGMTSGTGGTQGEPEATGGEEAFMDPGCPQRPAVEGRMDCDPFTSPTDCGVGERCVPYVRYADDCGSEEFGTECVDAGFGVQGDDCVEEPCSAGFVCVTTGEGSQCAGLCRVMNGVDDCPDGLLCQSLDVDGFQICF